MRAIAEALGINTDLVRKVLIAQGIIDTPLTRRVAELQRTGMSQKTIAEMLGISTSTVCKNSAHVRGGSYKNENKSVNAVNIARCRAKKKAQSEKA